MEKDRGKEESKGGLIQEMWKGRRWGGRRGGGWGGSGEGERQKQLQSSIWILLAAVGKI